MQDQPRQPGEDAQKDPSNAMSEEGNALKKHVNLINVIQQNAVVITGREVKWHHADPYKSNAQRWL